MRFATFCATAGLVGLANAAQAELSLRTMPQAQPEFDFEGMLEDVMGSLAQNYNSGSTSDLAQALMSGVFGDKAKSAMTAKKSGASASAGTSDGIINTATKV